MSQKIVLRAGFKEITGPEFSPAAISKGPKLFGHVFNVEESKICTFCLRSWWPGVSCFDRWIYLSLRARRQGLLVRRPLGGELIIQPRLAAMNDALGVRFPSQTLLRRRLKVNK